MMKKFAAFALTLVLMLSLCGCDMTSEENKTLADFMDENTLIVQTADDYAGEPTPADFGSESVKELYKIDLYGSEGARFYALKVGEESDINVLIMKLCELDFVQNAWQNKYDYKLSLEPLEDKGSKITGDGRFDFWEHWVTIVIDKNYAHRMFTPSDFEGFNVDKVVWKNDKSYKQIGLYGQRYAVHITDEGKQAVLDAMDKLYELDFVKSVMICATLGPEPGTSEGVAL